MSKAVRIAVVSVAGVIVVAAFTFAYLSGTEFSVPVALVAAGAFLGGILTMIGLKKP
jgi:uncharacterized integral membrane protein